jgi:hypothetical protein
VTLEFTPNQIGRRLKTDLDLVSLAIGNGWHSVAHARPVRDLQGARHSLATANLAARVTPDWKKPEAVGDQYWQLYSQPKDACRRKQNIQLIQRSKFIQHAAKNA